MKTFISKILMSIILSSLFLNINAQTYSWIGADGADWTVSTNWSPSRTTPATSDILVFNNGGTYDVTNIQAETIKKLLIQNNTDVSFQTTADITLTINGSASDINFLIEDGSKLQISSSGTNRLELKFSTSYQDVDISGHLIVNTNDALSNTVNFYGGYPEVTVNSTGKIINNGGVVSGYYAEMYFSANAEYQHNRDGGIVPDATWNNNSLCNITGIVSNYITDGFDRTFGHVTWNCPMQNSDVAFSLGYFKCLGNLTISSTGTGKLILSEKNYSHIYVEGDFNLVNGDVDFNNTSNYYTDINLKGDFIQSGGSLQRGASTGLQYFTFNSQGIAKQYLKTGGTSDGTAIRYNVVANAILNINSDINIGEMLDVNEGATVFLNANLTGTGTFYIRGSNSIVILTTDITTTCQIVNRGKLHLYDYVISGTGNFDNYSISYATLYIGHPDGITATTNTGNIQVSGTRSYGSYANYTYNGFTAQTTGDGLTQCYYLTIDNPAGVSLSGNVNLLSSTSKLFLTNGILELGNFDLTINNPSTTTAIIGTISASNMIVTNGTGYFKKYFATDETSTFQFPVGDNVGTVEFTPVNITFADNSAGLVGLNITDAAHPTIVSYSDYLSRYYSFSTNITSYVYSLNYNYIDPDDINGDVANMLAVRNTDGVWNSYPSTIGGGNVLITSNPLNSTTCPLNGSIFSAANQEIICEPNNGFLYERFLTSSLPSGWSTGYIQGTNNWKIQNTPGFSSASGGYYAIFDDEALGSGVTPNEAWIKSPKIYFCNLSSVFLSYYEYWYGVENTYGYVEISTDEGNTWTIVNTNSEITVGSLSAPIKTVIDITPYLTNNMAVIVRFRYKEESAVGKYWLIDDINIFSGDDVGISDLVNPPHLACSETYSNSEQVTIRVYNYSFQDVTNIDWTCNITGGFTGSYSGTVAAIPANSYVDVNVATIDMSADNVYHFNLNATPQTPAIDGNLTNNTLLEGRRQLVQTYPYSENFNTTRAGWYQDGPDHQPPNTSIPNHNGREFVYGEIPYLDGAEGEGNSWYVKTTIHGKYDQISVVSPVFDFSNLNNPVLSMDLKYQLYDYYYSQFNVEYSINNGANWYYIGNDDDPNWYEGADSYWTNNFSTPVNQWKHVEHDLCKLSGQPCVRFRISAYAYYGISGTTNYRNRNYIAVDNFSISAGVPDDIEPVALTLNNSGTCSSYSNAETMQVLINNYTCRPLTNVPVSIQVDGGAVINEVMPGPIPGNGSYLYTFNTTTDLSTTGVHTIVVTTNLATDGIPANNILTETRINNKIVVDGVTPYSQDFNSGNAGWVSRVNSGTDGTRHFRLDEVPYLNCEEGEQESWYIETKTNNNYTDIWVESPVFDLNGASNPVLYMDLKYQFYNYYYCQAKVEYSANGGAWTQLGTNSDPNWYEGNANYWTNNLSNPVNDWTTFQHSLCDIMSLTPAQKSCVKFRIRAYAYYGPQADDVHLIPQINYSDRNYFAFDNFKIIDANEVGVTAILDPDVSASTCLYDQNQIVTIEVENYGCGSVYNVPVKVQIDLPTGHPDFAMSPLLFTGTVPEVPGNSSTTYTFSSTFNMTPMGVYNLTSWSEMPGDINTTNDAASVSISVDFPKITTYPFLEDFNTNDGFWISGGENPPDNNGRKFVWGDLPYLDGPEGNGKSWYVEVTSYGKYDWFTAESPVFDFSQLSNPVLYADIKYQFYNYYYSQMNIEYSINGGTWKQLGTSADPNWYVGNTNYWTNNYATPVSDWTTIQQDLCDFAGEECVKFRFKGYAYYGISGTDYRDRNYFAFDNFRITGGNSDDAEPIAITLNNSGVCGSFTSNETIQVIVNNNLCRPLTDVPITLNIDGTDIATEIIPGPIPRFGSYMYSFSATADLSAVGNHTITVTTNLPTDADNTNDTYSEIRINNSPITISPGNNYQEDFNSGNGGWVSRVNSNTDGTRHFKLGEIPYLNGPEGEGESWYIETTTNNNYTYIWAESPVFDLSAAVDPILKMDTKFQFSNYYYSQAKVEYSTNGGTSWTQLGTSADPDWYTGNTNYWTNNYDTPQDAWKKVQHKLCNLKGQSCVKFRIFAYAYYGPQTPDENMQPRPDYSNKNYFAFDNFEIIDAQDVGVTAFVDPAPNDVTCLYSDAQTVTVTVYNWSCTEAVDVPVNVEVSFNGTQIASFSGTVPSIPAGNSVDYTFAGTFDMLPIGNYYFNSYTSLTPDASPENNDTQMNIEVPFPRITTYPYIADFNGDTDYWIADGDPVSITDMLNGYFDRNRDFVWGEVPYLDGPEGEGESWYIHTDTRNAYYQFWVESPVFDLSTLSDPFLIMDIKYQLYNYYYSQVKVEYSINGGTWTQLGTSSDPDWYEGSTNYWTNNYSNPVSDWTTVFHNLCNFAGESCVKFRIIGYAYYYGANEDHNYFAFDNFRIIDGFKDASVSSFITPVNNEAPCTFDAAKEVTVEIKGASCNDLVDVPVFCDINGPYGITYNLSGTVTIPANTTVTYTFPTTVDLRSVGTYTFTAYTVLPNDDFPSNDQITQTITTLDTLINTYPYYADFNGSTDYWRAGNNSATPTRNFLHGQFDYLNGNEENGDSWYVETTTNGAYDLIWVESPVFDFTELDNPIFSFQIKYQLYDYYYSQLKVEYSLNGGSWVQLGTDADPNWYVGNTNYWHNNLQNPIDEWTYVEHNLCNLKGESCVKLRIVGYAYYGGSYQHRNFFAFDNIAITDTDLDAELTDVRGCYGTEYQLEVDVTNRNNFCQLFEPCPFDGQKAIQFDNNNDRVELGIFPELTNFTVQYWMYNPANSVGDYRMNIVAESNRFEMAKMNNGLLYYYTPTTGWINTGKFLSVGEWSHITATSDGINLKIYVNGELVHTRAGNITIAASNWGLGARLNSSYPTNAYLDEVRIWNIALSESEIRANICGSLTGTETGLVAYYQMENGTGSSILTDITGNGHTGTLVNMDVNSCWINSDLATNNNGVATDPYIISSIDVCFNLDGTTTCNTYPVDIDANETETIIIPNITIPNGLSLGNNLCSGGVASASHTYSGSNPNNAFDNIIDYSGWANTGNMPCWLQYDLGAGREAIVNTYRIYCSSTESPGYTNSENYNPATWQLQGSNDETNWDILDNVYYGNLSMNTWKIFHIDNSTTYRYYRIYNTYGENSNYIHITELQMFYVDPDPSSLVVWIENPNGLTDEIPINDTIYTRVDEFPHCNDHCAAAIELINAETSASSNANATIDPLEDPNFSTTGCSGVTLENTSWYYFTTNCRGGEVTVTFDNIVCSPGGTGVQVSITRLDAEPACDPANHTEVFCAFPGDEQDIIWNPTDLYPDTQYYITIDGVAGNTCDFKILLDGNVAFNPVDAMHGDRIIEPSSSTFPNFQAAIDSLNFYGVSGPVHFDVADVPFNEQILIGTICGVSDVNTITFETWCDDCGQAILEHNADATDNYTLKLYRTSYLNFKNFAFNALGTNNGRVLDISENTHDISFDNCSFNGISTSDNSDAFSLVYNFETIANSYNLNFIENEFNNGSFGLNFTGKNQTQNISGLNFDKCLFNNQSFSAINLVNSDAPIINQNIINSNSTRNDFRGISLISCNNELNLTSNIVSASSANGYGLFIDDLAGISGSEAQIINNMFSVGNGTGTSYGINIESSTGNSEYIYILFNSTNLLSTNGAAFRVNTADLLNIKNNNFISASANSYDVTTLTNSTENYNNFLPDYAGKGANSININPIYLSVDNLHTENAGLQAGDNTTGISTDFDGETRQNPPYIGADEYLGSVIWTGNTDNDWNKATNWQPNTYISNATNVIIPTTPVGGNFPETNSNTDNLAETKNLTIQTGSHLYIAPNKYLTVWGIMNQNGTFVIQSDATGTGSFINKNTINYGTETTTVQRYISPLMWHYVSSPITSAPVNLFHPNNFYFYDETVADSWNMQDFSGGLMGWTFPTSGSNMNIMQGYITYQNQATVEFTGELNTDEITYNLSYTDNTTTHGNSIFDGWNLIGNPYPSTLNWYDNNNITKTNIDGAIYFYIDDGTGAYNNYSYFLPESYTNPYPSIVLNRVSGCIPVSQSFFVKANSTGASITVNNGARIHNDVPFYKSNFEEPYQIRLTAFNSQYSDETILRFIPEATENYDGQLDAIKLVGYSVNVPYLFSLSDDSLNLSINSLPQIDTNSIVNLGFKTGTAGQFSISMNDFILPDSITPYLLDLQENTETDLTKNNTYEFYSNIGTYRNRFKIIFKLQTNNNDNLTNQNIIVYSNKMNLFVNFIENPKPNTTITVYDITGKKIKRFYPLNKYNVYELNYVAEGIYNVIINQNQKLYTKKIILIEN